MKRKRTKPAQTKVSVVQQASLDGWIYVYAPKTIRGWNSIWVEGSREGQGGDEERALRPCIPAPIECVPPGSIERCSDNGIEQG